MMVVIKPTFEGQYYLGHRCNGESGKVAFNYQDDDGNVAVVPHGLYNDGILYSILEKNEHQRNCLHLICAYIHLQI